MAAQPWLEDLSDDWIPQPAPSSRPSVVLDIQSVPQHKPQHPRSRIPRLRNSPAPFAPSDAEATAQVKLDLRKRKSVLAERSLSDNNIVSVSSSELDVKPGGTRQSSRSFSVTSGDSMIRNNTTVELHSVHRSPPKASRRQDTPEWRRRLLKGQMAYGDQKDLFSPMGLEKLFKRPSPVPPKHSPGTKSGLSLLQTLGDIPSSPPPWPSGPITANGINESLLATWSKYNANEDNAEYTGADEDSTINEKGAKLPSGPQNITTVHHTQSSEMTGEEVSGAASYSQEGYPRTVSGQTEMRNENFSPVYISKNNTLQGHFDVAMIEESHPRPVNRSESLRQGNEESDYLGMDRHKSGVGDISSLSRLQDDTLPDDLPVGTPDAVGIGKFVTTRRGGYSNDGSFHTKPLSPTPAPSSISASTRLDRAPTHSQNPEVLSSEQRSAELDIPPCAPTPPPPPVTPRHGKSDNFGPIKTRSSRSPLKLFGDHDTFTSNRLHRRLSQLEDNAEASASERQLQNASISPDKSGRRLRLASVDEISNRVVVAQNKEFRNEESQRNCSNGSSFGHGELDTHKFPENFSVTAGDDEDNNESSESEEDGSPASDALPPGAQPQFRFRLDESPTISKRSEVKGQLSKRTLKAAGASAHGWPAGVLRSPKVRTTRSKDVTGTEHIETLKPAEGKRPPNSPAKTPTPKRRRTLHAVDVDHPNDIVRDTVIEKTMAVQSVIGRKRKDARQGIRNNIADPETLAKRHILRPRNPTPSQRRREQIQAEIMEATEAFVLSSPRLHVIQEHLDSSNLNGNSPGPAEARAVANEVAAFSMKLAKSAKGETRKRSVTTQDFLDEAMKIMEFIRTKGRPASGLGSLEESESESPLPSASHLDVPSKIESFSRPASRDGPASGWRNPNAHAVDPRVLNHLKKFQERSDDFLGSSVRSLHVSQAQQSSPRSREIFNAETYNIRVHESHLARSTHPTGDDVFEVDPASIGSANGTHNSNPSTTSTLGKTAMSNSSRRSENVATLAPEAVAHLIPQEIAGMSFDREKGVWVKKKSTAKEENGEDGDASNANASEDDPFRNIPDLSIDEAREHDYKVSPSKRQEVNETSHAAPNLTDPILSDTIPDDSPLQAKHISRSPLAQFGSVRHKQPYKLSSPRQIDLHATSHSQRQRAESFDHHLQTNPATEMHQKTVDEIEHEIKIDEGRNGSPRSKRGHRIRDITLTFTSPVTSRSHQNIGINMEEGNDMPDSPHQRIGGSTSQKMPFSASKKATLRSSKRTTFLRDQLDGEYVPSIDELNEVSIIADDRNGRRMKLSVSLGNGMSSNLPNHQALVPAPSSPSRGDVTFYLSDLPDFSVNQVDEREIPERVLVKRDGSTAIEDRYGLGTADLVRALQDAEPDEPYWEDLRYVNLARKSLSSLHRLEAFCWRLEEVDVSNNSLYQVVGLPASVRRLKASNNCLSSLSTWEHLPNLQYLDVSNNDIDTLKGFSGLIHLRELQANDNRIQDLDGVMHLDGLMKLSLQNNKLAQVDFEASTLKCLIQLNLCHNRISLAGNLHMLPQLQELNLDDNLLTSLSDGSQVAKPNFAVKRLSIHRNELTKIDVSGMFPHLECIQADQNRISNIHDLEHLRHLHTISLREQQVAYSQAIQSSTSSFTSHSDLHNISLSANVIPRLYLPHAFLNLQRVELATCGLQALPDNFGIYVPNVRTLNLNSNAIKDLRPLLNTKRLAQLHVTGNRISRLRRNLAVLAKLTTLTKIDLRDNPFTVGFYPVAAEKRIVPINKERFDTADELEPYTLPDQEAEAEGLYSSRLDDDTKLRKRVYQIMLATSCPQLEHLDGLKFCRETAVIKDEIWNRLLLLGVLKKSTQREGPAGLQDKP